MDIIKVMETFPTQGHCIAYLAQPEWIGSPECPHCQSSLVGQQNAKELGRIGRWNCHTYHKQGETEPRKSGCGAAKDAVLGME